MDPPFCLYIPKLFVVLFFIIYSSLVLWAAEASGQVNIVNEKLFWVDLSLSNQVQMNEMVF